MASEALFDHLAYTFKAMNVMHCRLEDLVERAGVDVLGTTQLALRNAMLSREVLIEGGMVTHYQGHSFRATVPANFRKFVSRAVEAIETADRPVDASDLIGMTGLSEGAIPFSAMAFHLKKVGIHFIPGMGYWHQQQFVDENGALYGAPANSEKAMALFEAFREFGWPLTGEDIEAATSGLVTSLYLKQSVKRPWPEIASVGYGLYVPAGLSRRLGFPMSRNIAQSFLDLEEDEQIDSRDNTRMYRLCSALQKWGHGVMRKSSTVRDGKQRRIAYFTLNQDGRSWLYKIANRRRPRDEF